LKGKDREEKMDNNIFQEEKIRSGSFRYRDGRLYFTGQLERRVFFAGTIIMMAWGILDKFGVF